VLREAAATPLPDFPNAREGFIARLVAFFPPQPQGMMSAEALDNVVDLLSCPGLDEIIDTLARQLP